MILEIGQRFGLDYFYIIGSSSILAFVGNPGPELTMTRDVDVIPNITPLEKLDALADQIDFVIGEGSDFDNEYGYYAQGVDFSTPSYAPSGWIERCRPIRVGDTTALCMEPHDLVISKLGAGRVKDLSFAAAAAGDKLVRRSELLRRVGLVDSDADRKALIENRIEALFAAVR